MKRSDKLTARMNSGRLLVGKTVVILFIIAVRIYPPFPQK